MARHDYQLKCRVAWWVRYYIWGVVLMCQLTGHPPDMAKFERWVRRGIRFRVVAK